MASHTFTVRSNLAPARAFARLIDLECVPQWDAGVRGSKRIDPGDGHVGARYEVTVTGFDGQPTTVVYEVTDVDEPKRFVMVGQNEVFRAADTLAFEPVESGCELTYHGTLDFVGDDPPLTAEQLDAVFPKVAGVAEAGLTEFLNRPD
ncbi:MAG: hypothetical protein HKN44_06060 [Ilumatobacter sp.]|nr:hypothetical protein [Ilumatobacter sp.]